VFYDLLLNVFKCQFWVNRLSMDGQKSLRFHLKYLYFVLRRLIKVLWV